MAIALVNDIAFFASNLQIVEVLRHPGKQDVALGVDATYEPVPWDDDYPERRAQAIKVMECDAEDIAA